MGNILARFLYSIQNQQNYVTKCVKLNINIAQCLTSYRRPSPTIMIHIVQYLCIQTNRCTIRRTYCTEKMDEEIPMMEGACVGTQWYL